MAAGTLQVTEVDESGSVPELLATNTGDEMVLLLDGEELVGAKQNRILNITLLAPAMQDTVIPVSCVENVICGAAIAQFNGASLQELVRVDPDGGEEVVATGHFSANQVATLNADAALLSKEYRAGFGLG